jgi:hypothetical protein
MIIKSSDLIKVVFSIIIFLWSYSVSVGGFDLGVHLIALLVFGIFFQSRFDINYKNDFIIIVLIGIYSIVVGVLNSDSSSFFRIILSSLLFIISQFCVLTLVTRHDFDKKIFFNNKLLIFVIYLALIIDFINNYPVHLRYGGLFKEPSHLAISIVPYLFYLREEFKSNFKFYLLIIFPIILFSFSSTLILSILFLLTVNQLRKSKKSLLIYSLFFFIPLIVFLVGYVDYINLRVLDVINVAATSNQSSLVYVYGWESMCFYFKDSLSLGIGLNGLGMPPFPEVNSAVLLTNLDGDLYKNPDGSFLFSKVISELGIVGILLIISVFRFLIKTFRKYETYNPLEQFFWNTLALLFFTSFVRGVGFFDGPFIMGSISYFVLKIEKK